jgi:CDP-6-deoxy-D-xylo-4-hexulose-3-dehydrase
LWVNWYWDWLHLFIQCGLKPVFVDVNLNDFSFDYEKISEKITEKTRAIFITHLLGFPADIKKIEKMIAGTDIILLEDCCEAHGASIQGAKVGNFGEVSSFSFYWGHHMTTVEGGMICTNDPEIWKLAVLKRSHGLARELPVEFHEAHRNRHQDIDFNFLFLTDGFNVRNTELHAVLGIGQLRHLDRYIEIRTKNHERFLEIIEPYKNYIRAPYKSGVSSFCLPFLFENVQIKEKFQKRITAAGIESRPVVGGNLLRQPFLKDYRGTGNFKNAEFLHTNGFYVGNNQFVNEERLSKLENLLAEFFTKELG